MTETAGQLLRAAREASGQTLEDVARVTRIRPGQLAALEADNYAALPSLTQARGFIKNYAEHLGLDPAEVLARYDAGTRRAVLPALRIPAARAAARAAGAQPAAPKAARKRAARKNAAPPPVRPPHPASVPQVRSRGLRILSADVAVASLITLVLVSLLVWGGSQLASGAGATATATRSSLVALVTPEPTQAVTQAPPPTPTPAATTPALAYSGVNVTVHADQRVWVGVRVDGLEIFSGLMPPGEAREFVAQNVIEVATGNGKGTRVVYNGLDQGPMGEMGQVVIRLWTLQGMLTPTPTPAAEQ
jgi:cytoskeleton protein RodZ